MAHHIEKFRNQISAPLGHRLIGTRKNDLFIAAYPRSGSTWLRTMLSVILWQDEQLTSNLYNDNIPAVSIRNASRIRSLASPRHIMTHALWNPKVRRAIYMVRDGRDVLISLYHYMTTRTGANMDFDSFYYWYGRGRYGCRWEQHVTSWLDEAKCNLDEALYIVKFESLKADTFHQMKLVCEFAGIPFENDTLERAISLASIENMRNIEHKESSKDIQGNASFYRGGHSGKWQEYLKGKSLYDFQERSSLALHLAGY